MLSSAALFLAGMLVFGQSEKEAADLPDHNVNLGPIASLIGEWECKQTTGTGELRNVKRDTYRWVAGKQAILLDITNTGADGKPGYVGTALYFWDPAVKKIKYVGAFSGGATDEGVLVQSGDGGTLWQDRQIYPNGNQGHYLFKMSHDAAQNKLTIGWSKVSGSGSENIGPWEYSRVK